MILWVVKIWRLSWRLHLHGRRFQRTSCPLPSVAETTTPTMKESHILLARDLIINPDFDPKFFPQQLRQRLAISQVYPFAHAAAFLAVHALRQHHPIESFWTGDRRTEPNLLVGGLLVEDITVLLGSDFENTRLFVWVRT